MADTEDTTRSLTLPDELALMLLNQESGYFHQVPGWAMHCAFMGAVLAELSFQMRIDTGLDSLVVLDRTETGDPVLDPVLQQIRFNATHSTGLSGLCDAACDRACLGGNSGAVCLAIAVAAGVGHRFAGCRRMGLRRSRSGRDPCDIAIGSTTAAA